MDDSQTRTRAKSLQDILDARRESAAAAAEAFALPKLPADRPEDEDLDSYQPDGQDYLACGRVSNKTVPSLRVILKDQSERAFAYAHLDSHHPSGCEFIPSLRSKGNIIRLRFAGASAAFMVEITGRKLRLVWVRIIGHLTPHVHEYPGEIDSLGEDEPVITAITFTEIKEVQMGVRQAA